MASLEAAAASPPARCPRHMAMVVSDGRAFCIDRYEYPNVERALPAVLVSFEQAEAACVAEGKRLCAAREWAFACEGEAVLPYPVGLERTPGACNWDAGPEGRGGISVLMRLSNWTSSCASSTIPGLSFELGSHTASRATDLYNLVLSEARANSAVDYLIRNGVNAGRITARGYGEKQPVNRCVNDVECTEEEHQANRRTEFKVTRTKALLP